MESSESSFDSAHRQKKRAKLAASGLKGVKSSKYDGSSSEDEVDRQKRMIKAMNDQRASKRHASMSMTTSSFIDNSSSSSEDEVDRQKKMIRALKEKKQSKPSKKKPAAKASSTGRKGCKKSSWRATGKKADSDSDYSNDASGTSESDQSFDKGATSSTINNQQRVGATRKDRGSAAAISRTKDKQKNNGKKRKSFEIRSGSSGEDSDMGELNLQVEKEIERALKLSKKQALPSLLHAISWFRIILDEAHLIKDRSSSTAKAVFNLTSLNKWCLTGTPLQNRVGELFSLIRFLRLDPHSFYFCRGKDCNCKSLHYKFTNGRCDECSHSAMQHFSYFNKHILNPIKRFGYVGDGRKGMLTLKNEILDEVLLRRTKDTRASDIQLPPRIVKVRMDSLDKYEEDFYEALYTRSQAQFNAYVEAGTILNNYAHIFDILIRLRQVVDHPYLVLHSNSSTDVVEGGITYGSNGVPKTLAEVDVSSMNKTRKHGPSTGMRVDKLSEEDDVFSLCGFCHEPPVCPVHARCTHIFCESCVTDYLELIQSNDDLACTSQAICPLCEDPLSLVFSQDLAAKSAAVQNMYQPRSDLSFAHTSSRKNFVNRLDLSNFQSSTKLEALMQELYLMRERDCGSKAIVFSQFVNMLDVSGRA